jgi:threonine aldolase
MPADAIPPMQEAYPFYIWNEPASEVRWVTSWDTTAEDVDTFASLLKKMVEG